MWKFWVHASSWFPGVRVTEAADFWWGQAVVASSALRIQILIMLGSHCRGLGAGWLPECGQVALVDCLNRIVLEIQAHRQNPFG